MNKILGHIQISGKHWFNSGAYADKEILSIKDPNGGTEVITPSAIPSPFARIDRVKTAFHCINRTPKLVAFNSPDGNVIASVDDEQLVSHCLDLAELMFNYDNVKDKLQIIEWDRSEQLKSLRSEQSTVRHRRYADALDMYLRQDTSYNFDLMQRLYIMVYDHKVIGSTSPATLFFSTAADLTFAQIKLTTNDVTFDNKHTPLYKRDPEFQKYLHQLFKSSPLLRDRMNAVNEYLNKSLQLLSEYNHELYMQIHNLHDDGYQIAFADLDTGAIGNNVEVLGVPIKKRKTEDVKNVIANSDFVIQSKKYSRQLKPLVLQNTLNKPLKYVNGLWDKSTKVPTYESETNLERRWLPGVSIQYPYLTVSDFLEPYLMRMVYPFDNERFFDGNLDDDKSDIKKGYLLPLKQAFFRFFDVEELLSAAPNTPKIEMEYFSGSVRVNLRIPIAKAGEFITFSRTYFMTSETSITKPDEANNEGVIVEHQLGLSIFPFIRPSHTSVPPFYRVQLVDRDVAGMMQGSEFRYDFYSNQSEQPINVTAEPHRNLKDGTVTSVTSRYYVLEQNFDFIQVRNLMYGASGIVIPKWPRLSVGSESFKFAIDFGTTNTHIEYRVGDSSPRPFDITKQDSQIATLFDPVNTPQDFWGSGAIDIRELIDHEFVPRTINGDSDYRLPHRTAISQSHAWQPEQVSFTLADFNIPYIYERVKVRGKIHTNLKWAEKGQGSDQRVRAYLEQIVMMIRNKVLLNNGDVKQTQIVWFYPSSMSPQRVTRLSETWTELVNKYLGSSAQTYPIIESLAPFQYYVQQNRLPGGPSGIHPTVSIDIGGGTTDVAILQSQLPVLFTSFKYAANVIFGDGYGQNGADTNSMIRKYAKQYSELLRTNGLYNPARVFSDLLESGRSEDINAFLFSLENHRGIPDPGLFSYAKRLSKDDELKIVFLYFYSSLVYSIADTMHKKGFDFPKCLTFSGTGSKMLSIITSDMALLNRFTGKIFEYVYQRQLPEDRTLVVETERDYPKEVTCKGGLYWATRDQKTFDVSSIKYTNTGIEGTDKLTYGMIDGSMRHSVVAGVQRFNEMFLAIGRSIDFTDYFGISPTSIDIFKRECNQHLDDFLIEGIEAHKKDEQISFDDREIDETLFFYPLKGVVNSLVNNLASE